MVLMKILAPFSEPGDVSKLLEAGAKELYCGVVDENWQKTYTYVSSINLRHDKTANLNSFKELEKSVEAAHSMNARVFLTLNAHFYSQMQLPAVLKHAEKAVKANADALIVADSALIPRLKDEFSIKLFLSTAAHAFNNSSLDFFKELGISRIVLPRQLTVKEIGALSKHAKKIGLEAECFVLNVLCPYTDGLCTFQHFVDESISFMPTSALACRMPFKVETKTKASPEKRLIAESHARIWNNSLYRDCGLCALPYLKNFGMGTVKIAGRGIPLEKRLLDVRILKQAVELLDKKGFNLEKFRDHCKERYFEMFYNKCDYIHCYYAGVGLE